MSKAPLNDTIAIVISQMVDDSQVEKREPSHSDIESQFQRVGLLGVDPKQQGKTVGKAKRVRAVLTWAIENNLEAGEKLTYYLISLIRGLGGFRETSPNYVGKDVIENAVIAFKDEGYILSKDGNLLSVVLDNLSATENEKALKAYARRAKRGIEDAALLAGTSKDLMEAVAAHVILKKWGTYSTQSNFPTLLGQAFTALGLATSNTKQVPRESAQKKVERALFELACAINKLRNKEGTGHGRPFLPSVTSDEAIVAIESIGIISEFMLSKL